MAAARFSSVVVEMLYGPISQKEKQRLDNDNQNNNNNDYHNDNDDDNWYGQP